MLPHLQAWGREEWVGVGVGRASPSRSLSPPLTGSTDNVSGAEDASQASALGGRVLLGADPEWRLAGDGAAIADPTAHCAAHPSTRTRSLAPTGQGTHTLAVSWESHGCNAHILILRVNHKPKTITDRLRGQGGAGLWPTSWPPQEKVLFGHLFFNITNVFCAKKRVGHACICPRMVTG